MRTPGDCSFSWRFVLDENLIVQFLKLLGSADESSQRFLSLIINEHSAKQNKLTR